jgi:hypothetical protein
MRYKNRRIIASGFLVISIYLSPFELSAETFWAQSAWPRHTTQTGLDPVGNSIDRFVNRFGSACNQYPNRPKRACLVETKIAEYLQTLSSDVNTISTELARLGTTCQTENESLICLYKRCVETTVWKLGFILPESVSKKLIRVEIRVVGNQSPFQYSVDYSHMSSTQGACNEN